MSCRARPLVVSDLQSSTQPRHFGTQGQQPGTMRCMRACGHDSETACVRAPRSFRWSASFFALSDLREQAAGHSEKVPLVALEFVAAVWPAELSAPAFAPTPSVTLWGCARLGVAA